jgi:predicted nucleic acid-binding protein
VTTPVLVWDASALHHAARADRLDVLGDIVKAYDSVITATVLDELDRHGLADAVQHAGWLRVVHVDGLDELPALVRWLQLLSSGQHHRGEATVCAWAEVHGATAIMDDSDAKSAAAHGGLDTHGSLWVLAEGVRSGTLMDSTADGLADALIREGARYPFVGRGYSAWARRCGLL